MKPENLTLEVGIRIHLRLWQPDSPLDIRLCPFILLHGLSSNARTWDEVAARLAGTGHPVAAIDQRGHGLSEKPDAGYDFQTIAADLARVIQELGWERPVLAGQSWGGNLLLEFAACRPGLASGYVFVDGGFINLRERGDWDEVEAELRPPRLAGTPANRIAERIRQAHPDWSESGIEATMGNFEILPDGTARPWLSLERHLGILRAMYDQDLSSLYPKVKEPVLICAADDASDRMAFKRAQVQAALDSIPDVDVRWFQDSAHDIHVDQPERLAEALLSFQNFIQPS